MKVADQQKKDLGAVYTPASAVDFMIGQLVRGLNEKELSSKTLLEPSGGDGAFVRPLVRKNIFRPRNITVWDINPETQRDLEEIGDLNVSIKDTLLDTGLKRNLFTGEVFDFVIGNPPYLNKQSGYIKKNKEFLRENFREIGVNDTYAMFLYLGCSLLKPSGRLVFLISDTYRTLGIHQKLRRYLLENFTIEQITLCPKSLFRGSGVSVSTSIISLKKEVPPNNHSVKFLDCQNGSLDDFCGNFLEVSQDQLRGHEKNEFVFGEDSLTLSSIKSLPRIIDLLDGGIGMHTKDNRRALRLVSREAEKKDSGPLHIPESRVDGRVWRFYHKRGGARDYFAEAEHAIRWGKNDRSRYSIPDICSLADTGRKGFVISGVSKRLSARMATPGALWESNKAMCFFPKNPEAYPPEFFVGILNSSVYRRIAAALNHTPSLQIRDIKRLPMFRFSPGDVRVIARLVISIVKKIQKGCLKKDLDADIQKIDSVVNRYFTV